MILSKIASNLKKKKIEISLMKFYINNLLGKLSYYNSIKSLNDYNRINSLNKDKKTTKSSSYKQDLISFIINIRFSGTNTLINITDIKGNPKISFSSGLIGLKGRQKKFQPAAIINIFKILFIKAKFLSGKPVAIHFRNVQLYYESLIIGMLKNKVFIKSIRSYNLYPHNGCRPRKLKRFKRRTKK